MEKKLLEILNSILANNSGNTLTELNPDLSLRDDLEFDSFDLAELTVLIEDAFNVDIFENGIIDKLSEVVELIQQR